MQKTEQEEERLKKLQEFAQDATAVLLLLLGFVCATLFSVTSTNDPEKYWVLVLFGGISVVLIGAAGLLVRNIIKANRGIDPHGVTEPEPEQTQPKTRRNKQRDSFL